MTHDRHRVDDSAIGERLDRHVARWLDVPRNQVQRWIRDGRVTVEGRIAKASLVLDAGVEIEIRRPETPSDPGLQSEDGELSPLYVDEHVVAIDKPAGLAMHPGAGRAAGTLANRLLHHYPEIAGVGGPGRPGIVHRLDLDTTGVVLVARTVEAYRALSTAFADRRVDKRYLAIVHGVPAETRGTIDAPIGRHPRDRQRMTIRRDGRPAVSHWATRAAVPGVGSLVDLAIETGRTHQIRVHLKAMGHPLIGDPVYGEARWRGAPSVRRRLLRDFPRPALHARKLAVRHPVSGEPLEIEAPVPDDLRHLWSGLTDDPTWPPAVEPARGRHDASSLGS